MTLIDIHCHLDYPEFKKDLNNIIERARQANVEVIIANGVNPESNREILNLSEKYDIPLVATNDCHYISKGDEKAQEVLLAVQRKAKWKDENRWRFDIIG